MAISEAGRCCGNRALLAGVVVLSLGFLHGASATGFVQPPACPAGPITDDCHRHREKLLESHREDVERDQRILEQERRVKQREHHEHDDHGHP